MRAAVIFGLGSSTKDLRPFQKDSHAEWLIGLPATASEADAILVFGGDGTVHRHLAALVKLGLPVLVVPCGSGNDFARALGLRRVRDSLAAWRKFASGSGHVRTIDLGVIAPLPANEPQGLKPAILQSRIGTAEAVPFPDSRSSKLEAGNSKYFCCVGGVGLDAEVARRANTLPRWLRGRGGYALSVPPALMRFTPVLMRISVPDGDQFALRSEQSTVLAAFANAPAYGGGMMIAPQASLEDGQLDVCLITDIDRFKLFCLFPKVYFGRHLDMHEVDYFQTSRLRLETEHPLDVYADGEFVCQTPVDVSVAPRALSVIVL
jgi:diacylglycerol kinase (ATP)